jgi:hypothetical protein
VKDGAGKQAFTNSANVVHDVTVLQGNLEFTTAPTVHGDVSIAQGAELTLGSGSYSLNAGQTLNVLAGAGGMPAVLNNSLVLNGGSLQFGAYDSTTAVLSTQGVSLGSDFTTLNVLFGNTMSIREGSSYLLASGDWSAVAGKLTCDTGEYLTATLGATSNGLQVTFALADGYSVWRGDESVLQAGSKVLFGCFGGSNDVALSAPASIGSAYFDNLSDVTVSSANGASLTADLIEKHGAGALVINNTVNGDTLRVEESSLLTGSGRLAVDTMEISRGAQASISKLTVAVESAITGDGVLYIINRAGALQGVEDGESAKDHQDDLQTFLDALPDESVQNHDGFFKRMAFNVEIGKCQQHGPNQTDGGNFHSRFLQEQDAYQYDDDRTDGHNKI